MDRYKADMPEHNQRLWEPANFDENEFSAHAEVLDDADRQSLDRVWGSLVAYASIQKEQKTRKHTSNQQAAKIRNIDRGKQRIHKLPRYIATIAAVLFIIFLIGSYARILNGAMQKNVNMGGKSGGHSTTGGSGTGRPFTPVPSSTNTSDPRASGTIVKTEESTISILEAEPNSGQYSFNPAKLQLPAAQKVINWHNTTQKEQTIHCNNSQEIGPTAIQPGTTKQIILAAGPGDYTCKLAGSVGVQMTISLLPDDNTASQQDIIILPSAISDQYVFDTETIKIDVKTTIIWDNKTNDSQIILCNVSGIDPVELSAGKSKEMHLKTGAYTFRLQKDQNVVVKVEVR